MRIKFLIAIAAAALLMGNRALNAATVNWSAADTNELTLAGGTVGVPTGDVIEIGIFTISDLTIQANQNNPLFLQQNFSAFATSTIGAGTIDGTHPQGYAGVFSVSSIAPGTGYFSQPIYLLVLNVTGTNLAGSATQVGVYKGDASWVFPASDLSTATIDLDTALTSPLVGAYSANTFNSDWLGGNANAFQLHAIPEPSTLFLVGFGLLGAVMLRRRKKA